MSQADLEQGTPNVRRSTQVKRKRSAPRHVPDGEMMSPDTGRPEERHLVELTTALAASSEELTHHQDLLRKARHHIAQLQEKVEKLSQPPFAYAVFLNSHADDTADVFVNGRKMRVGVSPDVDLGQIERGSEVTLNEAMNVISRSGFSAQGEVVTLEQVLECGRRAIVTSRTDDEVVVEFADTIDVADLRPGDHLMLESKSGHLIEKLPKTDVEDLVLEEVPDMSYEDVGGLDDQLEQIRDSVELPFLHADAFKEYELDPPKGILLYGPPGCGKTLIAKAVASSLSKKLKGKKGDGDARSYFLNIKGPELLNKYVGETERKIREIFLRAKEKAEEGYPVIVFFDEMDSLFRTRGSGISSDIESTIVPQLLVEIDGVEGLRNVIVIGATNREDLIDPAILRPGRLDAKIKIGRPDEHGTAVIFSKYLTTTVPIAHEELQQHGSHDSARTAMIQAAVEEMYATSKANEFIEVTYGNGEKEVLYLKDFVSGAIIENVVRRAKKSAVKRFTQGGAKGLTQEDLISAVRDEFKENQDLPNTTNPDDWAKISGKKGQRIVYIRTLAKDDPGEGKDERAIEYVSSGQYL